MGDDRLELLRIITLGLALALATVFIPELILSPWPPSTPDSHGAVPALRPASGSPYAHPPAILPTRTVPDGCDALGALASPHDRALEAATDALVRSAVARKPAGKIGSAQQDPRPGCSCDGSTDWPTSRVGPVDGSLPCAAPLRERPGGLIADNLSAQAAPGTPSLGLR